jgi:hypothetical protein
MQLQGFFRPVPKTGRKIRQLEYPDWDPLRESRAQGKARILAAQLERKSDVKEKIYHLLGSNKSPLKLNRDHFDWLVLYQLKGLRFAQIATDLGESYPQTVIDGVKGAAQLIIGPEWKKWLRKPQRGRPQSR